MRALALVALFAATARADTDPCAPGAHHRGAPIDIDVKAADVRDVLRLITDVAHLGLVIGSGVEGKVTLRLQRVPWDAALCTIASAQQLRIERQDNILLVRRAAK